MYTLITSKEGWDAYVASLPAAGVPVPPAQAPQQYPCLVDAVYVAPVNRTLAAIVYKADVEALAGGAPVAPASSPAAESVSAHVMAVVKVLTDTKIITKEGYARLYEFCLNLVRENVADPTGTAYDDARIDAFRWSKD